MNICPLNHHSSLLSSVAEQLYQSSPSSAFLQNKYLTLKRWTHTLQKNQKLLQNCWILLQGQKLYGSIALDENTLLGPSFAGHSQITSIQEDLWARAQHAAEEQGIATLFVHTAAQYWSFFEKRGYLLLTKKPCYKGCKQFFKNAIPLLESARCYFRFLHPEDFDAMSALQSDPLVQRYQNGPKKPETTLLRLTEWRAHALQYTYGNWAICDKSSHRFIGCGGLFHYLMDEEQTDHELAYSLMPNYWGKGLGQEVVQALLDYGHTHLKGTPLLAITRPGNVVSRHILEKKGLAFTHMGTHQSGPACFHRMIL
jgi:[ribosomal protein S5]-alanine N-acetyltransferase